MPRFVVHRSSGSVDRSTVDAVSEAIRKKAAARAAKRDEAELEELYQKERRPQNVIARQQPPPGSHLQLAPLIVFQPTGREIRFSMHEMRDATATDAMAAFNRDVAKYEGASLHSLVKAVDPTHMRAVAASIIARLLDSPGFDEEGIRWESLGPSGNVLWIDGHPSVGYENYANVQIEYDKHNLEGTLNAAQRNSTLSIKRASFELWRRKADELCRAGHGLSAAGFNLETFSRTRLGAAFVIAYVFLVDEMQHEIGPQYVLEDSHAPDSSNPAAAFGWHADDHLELDDPPGPHLSMTVVCQCSAGSASMGVAGVGEIAYPGVGGFVCFPAPMLHRTLRVQPSPPASSPSASIMPSARSAGGRASMWKLTGFFARAGTPLASSPSAPRRIGIGQRHASLDLVSRAAELGSSPGGRRPTASPLGRRKLQHLAIDCS